MNVKIFQLLTLMCLASPVAAQRNIYQQYLYWIRYQIQLDFNSKLYWTNEVDNRRFINPDVQNQLIFHSRLHYKPGAWDVAGGVTLSHAYAARPETGYKNVITELRPVAELTHESKWQRSLLQNRVRIDNRFFETDEQESILYTSRYIARFRYRFQARIPLTKPEGPQINLRLAEEIMFNSAENFFDQNRIYATVDFGMSQKVSIETGYIYIYQQRFDTSDFFARHVFRFSILHRLAV